MRNPGRLVVPGEVPLPDDLPTREPNPLADLLKTGNVHVDAEMAGQLDQNLRANFSGEARTAIHLMAGSGSWRMDLEPDGHTHPESQDYAMFYNSADQVISSGFSTNYSLNATAYNTPYSTATLLSNMVRLGRTGWWFYVLANYLSDNSGGTYRYSSVNVADSSLWRPYDDYLHMYQNKDSGHRWRPAVFGIVKVTASGANMVGVLKHNAGSNITIRAGGNLCFVQWLSAT